MSFPAYPGYKDSGIERDRGTLDAHNLMSTQALNSSTVQEGLKDILLDHAQLWETLRGKPDGK